MLHQLPVKVDVEDNACQVVRMNVSRLANRCDPHSRTFLVIPAEAGVQGFNRITSALDSASDLDDG